MSIPRHPAAKLLLSVFIGLLASCGKAPRESTAPAVAHGGAALFANGDFETGSAGYAPTAWTSLKYTNPGITGTSSAPPSTLSSLNLAAGGLNETLIVNGATMQQYDPDLGSAQTFRYPRYGSQAVLVNYLDPTNNGKNKNANMLRQQMTISASDVDPLDGKIHVRFAAAPVLENPSHAYTQQPYYFIQLLNKTRSTTLYTAFNIAGQAGVPWHTTTSVKTRNAVQWLDWQLIDISPSSTELAIGDVVELSIVGSGCSLGGHFGRIYVDGISAVLPGPFVSASAPLSVKPDTDLVYTITYRNGGTGVASAAHVDLTAPPQTTLVAGSLPAACTIPDAVNAPNTIFCDVGSLGAGASGALSVTVHVGASATGSIVLGTYSIAAANAPALLGAKVVSTVVGAVVKSADIQVTKYSYRGAVVKGTAYTNWYAIKVRNNGPSAAPAGSFTFTDAKPSQISTSITNWTCAVTAAGSPGAGDAAAACGKASGSWNSPISLQPSLPAGAEITVTVNPRTRSSASGTSIKNTATVTLGGTFSDPDLTNNSSTVTTALVSSGTLRNLTVNRTLSGTADNTVGSVTSSPAGLYCMAGSSCGAVAFAPTATVTLTAVPVAGKVFSGWNTSSCTGCSSCTGLTCTVAMSDAAQTVGADFANPPAAATGTKIYVFSGDFQATHVTSAYALPLKVFVADDNGNAATSAAVALTPVTGSTGAAVTLSAYSGNTTNGYLSVIATANDKPGKLTVEAALGNGQKAIFTLTNVGDADSIVYLTGGDASPLRPEDRQKTPVGKPFATPLAVLVRDAAQTPVAGATVTFAVPASSPTAVLSSTTAVSDANGIASVTATADLVANTSGTAYYPTASIPGSTVSFGLVNITAGATQVFAASGTPQIGALNADFPQSLVAVVSDDAGNAVENVALTFTPEAASNGATATVSPTSINSSAVGAGSTTAHAGGTAGSYTVRVNAAGVSSPAYFYLANDGGQTIAVSNDASTPQNATVGAQFTTTLDVVVTTTTTGAVVQGAQVTFTPPATGAGATLSNGGTYGTCGANCWVTDSTGTVKARATANTTAGNFNIVASTPGAPMTAVFNLDNDPGPTTALVIVAGDNQKAKTSTAFGTTLTVKAEDANHNGTSASITFAATTTAGGATAALSPASPIATDSAGLASVTATANDTADASTYTVTADDGLGHSVPFTLKNISGCVSNADCPLTAPLCSSETCIACSADTDCDGHTGNPACVSGRCQLCSATNTLACPTDLPACDTSAVACVACTDNTFCSDPTAPQCDTSAHTCGGCTSDAGCVGHAGPSCDVSLHICVARPCPTLTVPTHGSLSSTTGRTDDVVRYACDTGYTMTGNGGNDTRTCLATGFWDGSDPSCSPVACTGLPAAPTHGTRSADAGTYGETVTYSCEAGYTIAGSTSTTCQADGTWTALTTPPSCAADPCTGSLPTAPANGSLTGSSGVTGDTVGYTCAAGYVPANTATSTCGTDHNWTAWTATPACDACPGGTYASAGAGSCSTCGAGSYSTGAASSCSSCDAGTFSGAGASSCTLCLAGNYAASPGSTTCVACDSGTFAPGDGASSCAAWSDCVAGQRVTNTPDASHDRTCQACGAGTFSTTTNAAACATWATCVAGERVSNTPDATHDRACAACSAGTFSTTTNAATCTTWSTCDAGRHVSNTPDASHDRTCADCTAGKYSSSANAATCADCEAGSYSGAGATACTKCDAGTFAANSGSSSCTACTGETFAAGTGNSGCTAWATCVAGEHVTNTPDASHDRTCAACTGSTFTATTNAATCSAWSTCAAGQKVTNTPDASHDRTCAPCAAGTYSGTTNAAACTDCSAGYFSTTGATSCNQCTAGTYASAAGSSTCTACAAGTFAASNGATSCGTWSDCAPGRKVSSAPDASHDRACVDCAAGTYSPTVNAASCGDCAAGFYSAAAAATCTACGAGTFTTATGSSTCSPWTTCAAGQRVTNTPSATLDRTCLSCAPGTFSTTANAASCSDCTAGTFAANAGSSTCSSCPAGTFAATPAASSCATWQTCAPGTYVATSGTATADRQCTTCASGYTSTTPNQPSCDDIDECATNNGGCTTHGTCQNNPGSYQCNCATGYAGSACADCATGYQDNDHDGTCAKDCATAGLSCRANASCSDASGAPQCACTAGGAACDNLCTVDGVCLPAGGCLADADCGAHQWCDMTAHTCRPTLANGVRMPVDPAHVTPVLDGACAPVAATLVCTATVCSQADDRCGYVNGDTWCDAASADLLCRSGLCGADHKCGLADGEGPCTDGTGASLCRSGTCSPLGYVCVPTGGCALDADCGSTQWCDTRTLTCASKLPNGDPLPTVPGHAPLLDGVCTTAAALAVCASGVCDVDGRCGYASGDGTCSSADAGKVCRSGLCSTTGICRDGIACYVDADCDVATSFCDTSAHVCAAKLPSGALMPVVSGHAPVLDGHCTAGAAAAVCQAGVCDVDDRCGLEDGHGSCTAADAGSVCRSGTCSLTSGVCIPANGCAADGDCSSGKWCDLVTFTCTPKLPSGEPLPYTVGHCTPAVGASVCVAGVCDVSDDQCGYADGGGPCDASSATVCRSGVCSAAGICQAPAACAVDADCAATQFCDTGASRCVAKLPNGVHLQPVVGHSPDLDGTCSVVSASIECASGVCDVTDDTCGYALGQGPCTATDGASICRSGVCAATGPNAQSCVECTIDGQCGGGRVCDPVRNRCVQCSAASAGACVGATPICDTTAGVCTACDGDRGAGTPHACGSAAAPQCAFSGPHAGECFACTTDAACDGRAGGAYCDAASGACVTACTSDASCGADGYCGTTGVCLPKLANGEPLPAGTTCTAGVGAAICQAGVCDTDGACGLANGSGSCGSASVCRSAACGPDGRCGFDDGAGPCSTASQCRAGTCTTAQVCSSGCTSDVECGASAFCSQGGACTATLPDGSACSSARQCQTGVCTVGQCGTPEAADLTPGGNGFLRGCSATRHGGMLPWLLLTLLGLVRWARRSRHTMR